MKIDEVMEIARAHVRDGESALHTSAVVALEDAESLYRQGKFFFARGRARDAISYMVGFFHEDFRNTELKGVRN